MVALANASQTQTSRDSTRLALALDPASNARTAASIDSPAAADAESPPNMATGKERLPDLIDKVIAWHAARGMSAAEQRACESALRAEFSGSMVYIGKSSNADRELRAREILSAFNGRNAREVAREMGVSLATVYRRLKQANLAALRARAQSRIAERVARRESK